MSLMRLLSTGRSLVGFNDAGSRYRVTRQKPLPTFGSPRNPFRTPRTISAAASSKPASPEPVIPLASPPPGATAAGGSGQASASVLVAKVAQRQPPGRPARRMPGFAMARRLGVWADGLAARMWQPRPRAVRASIPRFQRPEVQGELSLDMVKVVRNDLSDADLEMVPVRRRAAGSEPAKVCPAGAPGEAAGTTWGRMSARFFGAGKR